MITSKPILVLLLLSLGTSPQLLAEKRKNSADDGLTVVVEESPDTESNPEIPDLKPRRKAPAETKSESPFLKLKPRAARPSAPPAPRRATGFEAVSVSFLYQTPLIGRSAPYDAAFSTAGLAIPVAIPITAIGDLMLQGEVGISATYSSLTFGATSGGAFSHLYFFVPLRARVLFPLTPDLALEGQLGVQYRLFEYDSRATLDGGSRVLSDILPNLFPDAAVGVTYGLSDTFRLRAFAGYLFLSGGLEWRI